MPNASAAILLNKEVIAVNQDSLVRQGRRVSNYDGARATMIVVHDCCSAQHYYLHLTLCHDCISGGQFHLHTLCDYQGINIWKKELDDGSVAVAVVRCHQRFAFAIIIP